MWAQAVKSKKLYHLVPILVSNERYICQRMIIDVIIVDILLKKLFLFHKEKYQRVDVWNVMTAMFVK